MLPDDIALLNPEPGLSRRGTPTWEVAYLFPTQGTWEESEYLSLGTNWMIEFEDGCLEVLPMPTLAHQLIVDFLVECLKAYLRDHGGGRVLFAPLPVRFRAGKYREPDVIFLNDERVAATGDYPDGADLVMEVVSSGPTNRERDLITGRVEYAHAGIREYWIVDPTETTITVLTLTSDEYSVHGEFAADSMATSLILEGFRVAVRDVFAAAEHSA
ncbi:MAG: Uma2 family endonuclease [Planctomycetaceae bacterium]|nr:Uma2 family endonuclease [Planctomycetaceae bacterium]